MGKSRVIQTVLRLKDNFSKPLKDAKATVKDFTDTTSKNHEKFKKMVKKAENSIAKDLKRIKKNFKQLATDITKSLASISYRGLQKGMDMLKKFSFLGGTLGVASLGAGIFEGMDYETYKVQLITATKDTQKASQLMRDAISFANKTPFETGQIIEATAKFESMGLSAKKWLSITADMAGATSKDMIQAVEAVIDAVASGEFERLKEFGLSKKTLEDLDTSGNVFNNKGQVMDQLALTELLFTEMEKRYKGGAESLSKTTKGMWSTVTGVFKNSMAKIVGVTDDGMVRTGSLLDSFRGIVEKVANKMIQWQQDGTIEKISAKFDSFLARAKDVFEYIGGLVDIVKEKFAEWKADGTIDNIKEKLGNIFKNVIDFIPTAINLVLGFLDSLNWILPIVGGIVAGVKTWGIVSNITSIALDLMAKKQAIVNTVAKIFNKTAWSNPWVLVIGVIVGAIVALILNWNKVNKFLKEHSEIINRLIIPAIQGIIISLSILTLWQKKTVIWNSIIATKSLFFAKWQALTMGVAKAKIFLSTVVSILTKKVNLLTGAQKLFNTISKANFMGIVITAIIVLVMILIKNWDKLQIKIDEIKQKFLELKEYAIKFWESLKNGCSTAGNFIKQIFQGVFNFFAKGINGVIEKINGLKINVPDWVPIIGGKSYGFDIPTIPLKMPNYATGTSYHRGGPAMINEGGRGEILDLPNGTKVIPPDKSQKLLDKNNSNNINITVNVYNPNNVDDIISAFSHKLKLAIENI
ncbi:hypothetical protein [[Clostridium] colinum]|uniref:hypothetical protein n=1 Tax=[Clostridium] colinum TaxID=36835 RepID=UPI002024D008|nr:hypothetical protein [[Clostridium] colinum]